LKPDEADFAYYLRKEGQQSETAKNLEELRKKFDS